MIKGRLTREVLGRFVLLAILHKNFKMRPYQWLLLSIRQQGRCEGFYMLLNAFVAALLKSDGGWPVMGCCVLS